MRSPQNLPNGETPSRISENCFQSTVTLQKLRRFNNLILLFRFAAFCSSIASVAFMGTNSHSRSATWSNFEAFRCILAANSIVAIYSIVEMGASVWEIARGETMLPEAVQLWFEFGHDQVFSYLLVAANASATALFRRLKEEGKCAEESGFCMQLSISIALGFCGFFFLGISSLLSGFRIVCYIITGSRFHL